MFDIEILPAASEDTIHKYTINLLDFINRFLEVHLNLYKCFLDIKDKKLRGQAVFLQLSDYINGPDTEEWSYLIKFPIDPEKQLEIHKAMENLAGHLVNYKKVIDLVENTIGITVTHSSYSVAEGESPEVGPQLSRSIKFSDKDMLHPKTECAQLLELIIVGETKRDTEGKMYLSENRYYKHKLTVEGKGYAPDFWSIPSDAVFSITPAVHLYKVASDIFQGDHVVTPQIEMILLDYRIKCGKPSEWKAVFQEV